MVAVAVTVEAAAASPSAVVAAPTPPPAAAPAAPEGEAWEALGELEAELRSAEMVQVTRALGRAAASQCPRPAAAAAQLRALLRWQAVVGFLAEAARARAVKAAATSARARCSARGRRSARSGSSSSASSLWIKATPAGAEARVLAAEARALGGLKFQNGRARASSK